jgi:hypothetical protein
MNTPCFASHLATALVLAAPWTAQAEAFHGNTGASPSMVGYAKPLSSNLSLRADLTSSPAIGRESIDEGAPYTAHVKSDRGSLLMDWHVVPNVRFTGGMTYSRARVDLRTGTQSGTPMFGEVPYATARNDRFDTALRAPYTLPYLGVGYGQANASGSSLLFDIGGTFSRASLGHTSVGPSLGSPSQAALDAELALLRDGIGRVRFMPQVSLGMKLRF